MAGEPQGRFSTREVLSLTGTSARQLQWWDERRLVVAAREGRNRFYSPEDLAEIVVIEELRRRRISLQRIRKVVQFLRRELGGRLADLVMDRRPHHLLLDGQDLYLETEDRQVVNLMRNTQQPVLLICLSDALEPLRVSGAWIRQDEKKPVDKVPGPAVYTGERSSARTRQRRAG